MKKPIALVVVIAACTLTAGCFSYSSTTRAVPAPAQSTVYTDTTTVPATTTVYTTR